MRLSLVLSRAAPHPLADDVKRRADVDFLLLVHPTLSVAYYEASVSPLTGKRRLLSVCRTGRGVGYRLPCPGNPIADGVGEGKPENANNGLPFVRGRVVQVSCGGCGGAWGCAVARVVAGCRRASAPTSIRRARATLPISPRPLLLQTLDMNQEGYFEEALKLPNALSGLGRPVPATGRPLVMLGLREHIYTGGLSAPAYFMSQQEHLFGTMFQVRRRRRG
jgi:callose synthase